MRRLRKPCEEHDRYDGHDYIRPIPPGGFGPVWGQCPGGEFLPEDPIGYLVYGEYIPYDIFWKHTPFAAPVDQVIALYAEVALASQVGESE